MDSWLVRIAVVGVVIVAAVVIVRKFLPFESKRSAEPAAQSFQDVIRQDDKRLRAEPDFEDIKRAEQPASAESKPKPAPEIKELSKTRPEAKPAPEVKELSEAEQKPKPVPTFTGLSEIEGIEAERLFEFAVQQRKIGRLPGTGFKPMVDACREIIQKFPGSEFDYKARRMLADIPERYRRRYKITEEEIDLARFFK